MFRIVPGAMVHLSPLKAIERRCFAYTWTQDMWQYAIKQFVVKAAFVEGIGRPAGFWVGDAYDEDFTKYRLMKLAVDPEFRGRGVSRALFQSVIRTAMTTEGVEVINAIAPEDLCNPNFPGTYIAEWLNKLGMMATGHIERDMFRAFGDLYDGFEFEYKLR